MHGNNPAKTNQPKTRSQLPFYAMILASYQLSLEFAIQGYIPTTKKRGCMKDITIHSCNRAFYANVRLTCLQT